jgi:tetratricopeptide (TPR) repeat protein
MRKRANLGGLAIALVLCAAPALEAKPADDALDTEVARRHFKKAKDHLQVRNYEEALKELLVARAVKPLPDFDFNIARCYELLERYPEAIDEYSRYVARTPELPEADEARERIRVLKKRMSDIAAVTGPKSPPPASAPASAPAPAPVAPAPVAAPAPAPVAAPVAAPAPAPISAPAPAAAALTASAPPRHTPLYKKWWLWTSVGAAVAVTAVAVGLAVGLSSSNGSFNPSLMPFGPNAPQGR